MRVHISKNSPPPPTHTHTHTHKHKTHMHTHSCMCTHTHTPTPTHARARARTSTRTRTRTRTHTHTHTRTNKIMYTHVHSGSSHLQEDFGLANLPKTFTERAHQNLLALLDDIDGVVRHLQAFLQHVVPIDKLLEGMANWITSPTDSVGRNGTQTHEKHQALQGHSQQTNITFNHGAMLRNSNWVKDGHG